jgi:hypothetical protein
MPLLLLYEFRIIYQPEVWLCRHADFINFNSEIRLFDWEDYSLSSENIDEMSIKFTNKFIEFAQIYIPVETITTKMYKTKR